MRIVERTTVDELRTMRVITISIRPCTNLDFAVLLIREI